MDPKENSNLNPEPNSNPEHPAFKDSPFPKVVHHKSDEKEKPKKLELNETKNPVSPIEEENFSFSESQVATPKEDKTADSEEEISIFSTSRYHEHCDRDIYFTSALRVRVLENGERIPDITWSELKQKYIDGSIKKNQSPSNFSERKLELKSDALSQTYKEDFLLMSQQKGPLRRSQRIAELKSQTCEKRKPEFSKSSKKLKKR